MKHFEKRVFCVSIILFLLISLTLVSAQTIVRKDEPQEQEKTSFGSAFWGTLTSPLFIGILVFIVIGIVLVGIGMFIIIKIIKYIKLRTDLFYRLKTDRIRNAKGLSRYINSKAWWKIDKNVPVRLVKKNDEGELTITKPIAYYRGDYLSNEGNVVIAVNFPTRKRWWIFPMVDLLIVPNKKNMSIVQKIDKGVTEKVELTNIPNAKDLVRFLDGEVLLFAESVASSNEFFFPVIKSEDGKVIDLAMPVFQSLKDVVIEDYLYTQTSEFVDIAKKSMDINPHVRFEQKTRDTNQSVDIPESRQLR